MLLMACISLDVIRIPTRYIPNITISGYLTSIIAGFFSVLILSPCISPILGTILTQLSLTRDYLPAILAMSVFSLGMMIPILSMVLTGDYIFNRIKMIIKYVKYILYIILIIMGVNLIHKGIVSYIDQHKPNIQQTVVHHHKHHPKRILNDK